MEENPGPSAHPPSRCRLLYSNINGLHGNLRELGVAAASHDVVVCAETRATARRHVAELRLPGFCGPTLLPCGERARVRGLALYVRDGFPAYRQRKYECDCCEMYVVRVCGIRQNFYLFGCYRNPDLDDHIFDCLLNALAKVQSEDRRAAFVFVGDFNAHHEEWLGSSRTDQHGRSACEFSALSDCSQLVDRSTHRDGGVLDLVLTDVPDLVKVTVGSCLGGSDHCSLSVAISCSLRVPDVHLSRTVLRKAGVSWEDVLSDLRDLDWPEIYRSVDPVATLEGAVCRIIAARVPTVTIRVRSRDEPWFDDVCRRAYERKQTCYFVWCRDRTNYAYNAFLDAQRDANAAYAEAEHRYLHTSRQRLFESHSAHKWWSVLKESVFGADSSIPPLVGPGGGLIVDARDKSEMLSRHFDGKQSRTTVDLPATCHPQPGFRGFAFRSAEVQQLLSDLDAYGGVDPTGSFPLFYKRTAAFLAPRISRIFRGLLKRGNFPITWRHANVVPIPKGPSSPLVSNFRPISITAVLSKVFERLISRRLNSFLWKRNVLPSRQYAYRAGFSTCDALLEISHMMQAALDGGSEARLVQIDFTGAFDKVNHVGLIYKLEAAGIGGSVLSVITQFLSERTQSVVLDGVSSGPVSVISGVPQGSVLGPILFSLYTSELFSILDNTLVGYADDSSLLAIIPSPSDRIRVTNSLNCDLVRISNWCSRWGMELNSSKTKSMIVSRSRTLQPAAPSLVLGGSVLNECKELDILGVRFDSRLTFGAHVRSVAASAGQRLGIMRKAFGVFGDRSLVARCFWSFLLPTLEYCSPVWGSAAECHLGLLDRIVRSAANLSAGGVECDLQHRRLVASLCMLYKITSNVTHPLHAALPERFVPQRLTRRATLLHDRAFSPVRCRTEQFQRSFLPRCVGAWNGLDGSVFRCGDLSSFKSAVNRFFLRG